MKKPTIDSVQRSLKLAQARLFDVQTRGDDAISKWDLRNGYDANFYLNVVPILQNHVDSYSRQLKQLMNKGGQLDLF